jgi:integrase
VNSVKHFLKYLYDKDIDIFLLKDVKFKNTDFQPYIYSDDEIKRYFIAVDTFSYNRYRKADVIQFPILFRLLYCCGCRINETLGIRKRDVDLDEGIIKLVETKNLRERFIVLGDDLKQLMVQFSDKYFYSIPDKGYIFSNRNKRRFDGKAIYDIHRKFLHHAGIPYLGGFHGPRLHDFRHTMAVKSFKQMLDAGIDMYVALPILSTYLGHKTIYSTERYVRLTMNIYPDIEKRFSKNIDKIFRK